jgi:hypothetical protein
MSDPEWGRNQCGDQGTCHARRNAGYGKVIRRSGYSSKRARTGRLIPLLNAIGFTGKEILLLLSGMDLRLIQKKIYEIRGLRVMLDYDLAELYHVETRVLKQAVKRNYGRFPQDFMFELTNEEIEKMISQNVIPSKGKCGGASPMVFTEQGVAMLSGPGILKGFNTNRISRSATGSGRDW